MILTEIEAKHLSLITWDDSASAIHWKTRQKYIERGWVETFVDKHRPKEKCYRLTRDGNWRLREYKLQEIIDDAKTANGDSPHAVIRALAIEVLKYRQQHGGSRWRGKRE